VKLYGAGVRMTVAVRYDTGLESSLFAAFEELFSHHIN
jgi:hypothetical protein